MSLWRRCRSVFGSRLSGDDEALLMKISSIMLALALWAYAVLLDAYCRTTGSMDRHPWIGLEHRGITGCVQGTCHCMIGIGLIWGMSLFVECVVTVIRDIWSLEPIRSWRSTQEISYLCMRSSILGSNVFLGHSLEKGVFRKPMRNLHSDTELPPFLAIPHESGSPLNFGS